MPISASVASAAAVTVGPGSGGPGALLFLAVPDYGLWPLMWIAAVPEIYVDPVLVAYAVSIVGATRDPGLVGHADLAKYVAFGASPRGSINLIHAARALALLRGRRYVVPADIYELAPDVLRHRIVPSFTALAEEVTADTILDRILPAVPAPRQITEERSA